MNGNPSSTRSFLDPTLAEMVDRVCDRFEAAWKAAGDNGPPPALADYLDGVEEPARSVLLRELLALELAYRRRRGERPAEAEYRQRFPGHDTLIDSVWGEAADAAAKETLPFEGGAPPSTAAALASASPDVHVPGYEILGELGRGGMGVVYQARQLQLKRVVALKMILHGGHAGAADLARFRAEAEAIARLQHPHIVQIHEVGEHEGKPYFSLEFCPGGSLDKKLAGTPLEPREAARLVETLARAMQAAHQQHVVHRDLKPANVLLTAGGQPKITDFGLARKMDEAGQTQSGAIMGTPSYMAPEQAGGKSKEIGPAADVYALGAILYECLTGRPPFKAATVMDTLLQVVKDDPVPPRQLQSKTPRDLETICLKCLQKEPRKRYGSGEALAEDLRRFQAGEPITARPVGAWERAVKWVRRRPAVAAFMALFVVSLLAGTAVSTYFGLDARQRAIQTNSALGKVTEREKQVSEAQAELEETLARSLLRPVGQKENESAAPEIEALWELSGSSERVRLMFVEQALQRPVTTRQLRNRANMAMHATVGLDPVRRQEVEKLLLGRLRDGQSDSGARTDCVLIGLALGDWSPEFTGAAAREVVQAMAKTDDPDALRVLAGAAASLAPRLGPDKAVQQVAAAARQALEAMPKAAPAMHAFGLMGPASRLRPDETTAVARQMLEAIAKMGEPEGLRALSEAAAALSPQLEPDEATQQYADAAQAVLEAMAKSGDPVALRQFSGVELDSGLGADEAVREILKTMAIIDHPGSELVEVAVLAPRLGPDEAAAAARQVVQMMARTNDPESLGYLSGTTAALAPRLGPSQAAAAARQILEAMAKTGDPKALRALLEAAAALAPRLGPDEAAAAARDMVQAMAKTSDPEALRALSGAVVDLVVRLDPKDAPLRASSLAGAVGNASAPSALFTELAPLMGASRPLPGRFTEQQLIDLLKMPTCQQPTRQVIIEQLGRQCGRPFANQWEFVDWAHAHRPDLDLTSPPVRPKNP